MAEAVNFCTPDWLPQFPKFKRCNCHVNNLYIDPELVYYNLQQGFINRQEICKRQIF